MNWDRTLRRSLIGAIVAMVVVSGTVAGAVGTASALNDVPTSDAVSSTPSEVVETSTGSGPDGGGPSAKDTHRIATAASPAPDSWTERSPSPGVRGDAENGTETHEVTLITGQTVTVVETGEETTYRVDAETEMRRFSTPAGTYVFPADVNFTRLDPALFNVDLLVEQNVTDGERSTIPVVVSYDVDAGDSLSGPDDLRAAAERLRGFDHRRTLTSIDATAGVVSKSAAGESVLEFAAAPAVERIEYDRRVTLDLDRSTEMVAAPSARRRHDVDGSGVRVAVLDSGIDTSHPDLDDGTVVAEKDFTGSGNASDELGHGTHVAGIITGDGDANGEYVGVAPGAEILNGRVLDGFGGGTESGIVDGIEWAVRNDADVISMSLGTRTDGGPDALTEAVAWARSQGVAVVVSAGNSGPSRQTIGSPAISEAAITVGAADEDGDSVVRFSSRGPAPGSLRLKPDLVAPGTEVASACLPGSPIGCDEDVDGPYVSANGTSMSAPHVSGVAALVMAAHPDWSPQRVENAMETTADPLPEEPETAAFTQGAGMVNATEAIATDVVVSNATLTIEDTGGIQTRVLTVRNVGDETRTLSVDTNVTNVQTGDVLSEVASTNRSSLELSPGESADLALRVDTGVSTGIYAGRVTLSTASGRSVETGGPYAAVFGFANFAQLTIEKESLPGTSATGDRVVVLPLNSLASSHSMPGDPEIYAVGDDGEVTVNTYGGQFLAWSYGENEDTGTEILTLGRTTVEGDTRLVLDESETATYSLDTSDLDSRFDSFETLSVDFAATLSLDASTCGESVPEGECEIDVSPLYADAPDVPRVRFARSPDLNVSVEYLLAPSSELEMSHRRSDGMESGVVYRLAHATSGVDGDTTYRPERESLASVTREFYHENSYSPGDPASEFSYRTDMTVAPWDDSSISGLTLNVGNRSNQTVYYTPGTSVETVYVDRFEGWDLYDLEETYEAGESKTVAVNRHPYVLSMVTEELGGMVGWFPTDAGPTSLIRSSYWLSENSTYRIRVDGTLVDEGEDNAREYPDVDPGETYNFTVRTEMSDQPLSTEMYGSFVGVERRDRDDRPPTVEFVNFQGLNRQNRVSGDEVTFVVNLSDSGTSVSDAAVWYAPASVEKLPEWGSGPGLDVGDDCEAESDAGWRRVCLTDLGDGRYRGTIPLPDARTTLHLAGVADDERGNTVRWATYDAVGTEMDNVGPTARAGPDRTVIGPGGISLDASGSTDPNDDPLDYEWEQVGGPDVTMRDADTATPEVSFSPEESETYRFRVTVDDGAVTATDTVTVTAHPDDGDGVHRALSTTNVSAGGTVDVTLAVEFEFDGDEVSILDGFEGPIDDATVQSISVDGEPIPDSKVVVKDADGESVLVALQDVPSESTATVQYRVDLAESSSPGDTVRFTGSTDNPDVTIGLREAEFGTDNATVVEGAVPRADTDGDGDIDDAELRAAIVGWSGGEYSDADLRSIVVEWSS